MTFRKNLLSLCLLLIAGNAGAATRNAASLGIAKALQQAANGDTVLIPAGTYTAPVGTTYLIRSNITILGPTQGTATLVNIRLFFETPTVSISNLTLQEKDCYSNEQNLAACQPSTPMIVLGAAGYPLRSATLSSLKLNYTRAYTGIAMGYDQTENVLLSGIQISDGDMSGVTIYQGQNIELNGVSITGSTSTWVDDGIAVTSYLGPISGVTITNSHASYTADLIGFGAQMKYPMSYITVENSDCSHVWYCLLTKTSIASQQGQSQQADINGFSVFNLKSH